MNPELLEEVLSCPTLPSPPAVAVKVIELTSDENVHLDDLAAVIKTDQGLAAKILRTVNSSFYGLRQPCATIDRALVMLGLGPVKTLALGFSLVAAVQPDEAFDFEDYWRRGLNTAVGAKCIADAAGLDIGDEAFLAGLLHDIGMVALFQTLNRTYADLIKTTNGDHEALCEAELAAFELQHPEIGAMLAERWKLPEQLVIPIRYHARPSAAPLEHAPLSRLVGAANTAHEVLKAPEPATQLAEFYRQINNWFALDADAADAILQRIAADTAELAKLFNLATPNAGDPSEVIRQARRRISELTRESPRESYGIGRFDGIVEPNGTDPLTGALNRAGFDSLIAASFREAQSTARPLSIVAVAMDGVVETASTLGDTDADDVVVSTVATLNTHFEPLGGIVARVATSTFAVILPATDRVQAARVAEDFRADVEAHAQTWIPSAKQTGPIIRAALGVAAASPETIATYGTPERLVAAVTKALAAAKAEGGNTVKAFQARAAA